MTENRGTPLREAQALSRLASIGLLGCALGFGLFYGFLRHRANAAPVVDLASAAPIKPGTMFLQVDHCRLSADKVVVRGWAVRKGAGWPLTRSRVVLRLADGRSIGLDTAWLEHLDYADRIHAQTHDNRNYYAPAFAASLDLRAAGIDGAGARLMLDWDDGSLRTVLPMDCAGGAR